MASKIIEVDWSWDQPLVQELLLKYYRDWLFVTPEIAGNMVDRVLAISKLQPPGEVLDIGCGLGYHAAAFAQKGFRVFAFDPADKYLELARRHIAGIDGDVALRQMRCADLDALGSNVFELDTSDSDTSDSNAPGRFSLAWAGSYCPGQLTPAEVVRDFERIYKTLEPGGWFVSNVAGKPKIPPCEKTRNWRQLSDCFALTEKWADEIYFYEHCWFVYPETNKIIKLVEVERMYGVEEIVPLLEAAGFTGITTANRLKGDGPARAGRHFAFWCRKPRD